MALTARQEELYKHRCSIYRSNTPIDGTGKPGAQVWSLIASDVPCYFQTGKSQHALVGFVRGESDNIFVLDPIHMEYTMDVRSGDVIKQTTGPEAGDYWIASGNPQIRSRRANKLMVECSKSEIAPPGVG